MTFFTWEESRVLLQQIHCVFCFTNWPLNMESRCGIYSLFIDIKKSFIDINKYILISINQHLLISIIQNGIMNIHKWFLYIHKWFFDINKWFIDINKSEGFMNIHYSFIDINNSFIDINKYNHLLISTIRVIS